MTRNPLFRKCAKCGDLTEHWRFFLRSYNKEGWACGKCDTLRDVEDIATPTFTGHTMETVPLEAAIQKTPTDCKIREHGKMTE